MRLEGAFLGNGIEVLEPLYDADADAELKAVARLYNRQLGPIGSVSVHRPEPRDLPLFSSSTRHSPVSGLIRDLTVRVSTGAGPAIPGGGKGATIGQAVRGALGESAERLLAVLHYQGAWPSMRLATYADLAEEGSAALGPEQLPLFAPQQYGALGDQWVPFESNTPIRWLGGRRLLSGEPVLVPAQLMLLYYERLGAEAKIGYPTTGGLGFHADRRRAVLHGLYEWIERDAINVGWACRLVPRRVDVDLRQFLPAPVPSGLDVRVFLNTLDGPLPVLTVIAHDRTRRDLAFLAGGGAWCNRRRALTQALYEVAQCAAVLRTLGPQAGRRIQPTSRPGSMHDFLDATVFYGYRGNERLLDWYETGTGIAWSDVPSLEFGSLDEEWTYVHDWLREARLDPVVIDFDAAAWPGVSAVKVLVPELTSAWVPSDPYLGHPRYYEVPAVLGRASAPLRFEDLNRLPLPFP